MSPFRKSSTYMSSLFRPPSGSTISSTEGQQSTGRPSSPPSRRSRFCISRCVSRRLSQPSLKNDCSPPSWDLKEECLGYRNLSAVNRNVDNSLGLTIHSYYKNDPALNKNECRAVGNIKLFHSRLPVSVTSRIRGTMNYIFKCPSWQVCMSARS